MATDDSATENRKAYATEIFLRKIDFVRAVAFRVAPEKSLMDDITHDAFLVFTNKSQQWTYDEETIDGLLKTIVENVAIRYWRIHLKSMPDNLQKVWERIRQNDHARTLEKYSELESRLLTLETCLQKLTENNRKLIESFYYDKTAWHELVENGNLSPDALYKRMSRIRIQLHDCVEKIERLEVSNE